MTRPRLYPGYGYDILTLVRPEHEEEARRLAAGILELHDSDTRNPFKKMLENRRGRDLRTKLAGIAGTRVVGDTLQYNRELRNGLVMSPANPAAPLVLAEVIAQNAHQVSEEFQPQGVEPSSNGARRKIAGWALGLLSLTSVGQATYQDIQHPESAQVVFINPGTLVSTPLTEGLRDMGVIGSETPQPR